MWISGLRFHHGRTLGDKRLASWGATLTPFRRLLGSVSVQNQASGC